MPLSPMLTTGHWDPAPGLTTSVVKVVQNGQVTAWGWTETTSNPNLRQEYWVLGPTYVPPKTLQTNFTHDSSGFPGGIPTTRAQFFAQLAVVWGGQPNVETCAGPATAMAALPTGMKTELAAPHAHHLTPPNVGGLKRPWLQVKEGTMEIWSGSNVLVGYLYCDTNLVESLVSTTNMVGPGLPLVLKPSQTQYANAPAFFAAMTVFLQSHGPPQRYESIANTWYPGVHPL